jgi:hypothetical protein
LDRARRLLTQPALWLAASSVADLAGNKGLSAFGHQAAGAFAIPRRRIQSVTRISSFIERNSGLLIAAPAMQQTAKR